MCVRRLHERGGVKASTCTNVSWTRTLLRVNDAFQGTEEGYGPIHQTDKVGRCHTGGSSRSAATTVLPYAAGRGWRADSSPGLVYGRWETRGAWGEDADCERWAACEVGICENANGKLR